MRLLMIRHGDPDYEHDTLTERGQKEAELLSDRLAEFPITAIYVSPLGRAKDTAAPTIRKLQIKAGTDSPPVSEKDWLQEFPVRINRPDDTSRKRIAWDWLPQDWTKVEAHFSRDQWDKTEIMQEGCVGEEYRKVIREFDRLLAQHGYVRDGGLYRAERPNRDTIAFFCHFGLECVLLSHLMNVSPMILWHHTCAAPSSVTSLYTEERRPGIAVFRMNFFGDLSHLYAGGQEPSFAARFCETWDNPEERHD